MRAANFMCIRKWALLTGLIVTICLMTASRVEGSPDLRERVREFAAEVKDWLERREQSSITVGQFVAPPQLGINPGPGLAKMLAEELDKLKISVKLNAKYGIVGDISPDAEESAKVRKVELKLRIVNQANKALSHHSLALVNKEDLKTFKEEFEKFMGPPPTIAGTQFLNKQYGVEILVDGGAARQTHR